MSLCQFAVQSSQHKAVLLKSLQLILDLKVNGIEMLFSRFSDKDCMKTSIKCLKENLNINPITLFKLRFYCPT